MAKKGFTMIELLAVIVIVGLLSTIGVMSVRNVLETSKKAYYKEQEDMLALAGKTYYSDYRSKLPKEIGDVGQVSLKTLTDEDYIDEVKGYKKTACDINNSYVKVQKQTTEEYSYSAFLKCDGYNTQRENMPPVVQFTPNEKTSNQTVVVTMKIKDDEEVAKYSYIVYRNGAVYSQKTTTAYKKAITIKLESDGKYTIVGTGIDNRGLSGQKESGTYVIDKTGPDCNQVVIVSDHTKEKWTIDDIKLTFTFRSAASGWEWYTNKYKFDYDKEPDPDAPKVSLEQELGRYYKQSNNRLSVTQKTIKETGKRRGKIILFDELGNTCEKYTDVYYIDKTVPKVKLTGSVKSNKATQDNVKLTVTTDPVNTPSGYTFYFEEKIDGVWTVVKKKKKKTYTVQEEGVHLMRVRVQTGAKKEVISDTYTVKIDRTPPVIKITMKKGDSGSCNSKKYTSDTWSNADCVNVTSKVTDNVGKITTTLNGDKIENKYTKTYSSEGTVTYKYKAVDEAKNKSTETVTVKLDHKKPSCSFSSVSSGASKLSYTVSCSDKLSGVSSCGGKSSNSFNTSATSTQTYTVVDNAGNQNTCKIKVSYGRKSVCGTESYVTGSYNCHCVTTYCYNCVAAGVSGSKMQCNTTGVNPSRDHCGLDSTTESCSTCYNYGTRYKQCYYKS